MRFLLALAAVLALSAGPARAQTDSSAVTPAQPPAAAPAQPPPDSTSAPHAAAPAQPPADSLSQPPAATPAQPPPAVAVPPPAAATPPPSAAPPPAAAPSGTTGVISGVIVSEEDHLPLPNARVGIYRIMPRDSVWTMVKGELSGADGRFQFAVPPATYRVITSCQSYSVIIKDDVKVAAGATVDIRISLTPKPILIKGSVVQGTVNKGSEASSLTQQKKADVVTDAITSEQIAKSTDSNAAEALQRVTGLSVVDGKYVYVRGLGERYSSTQVNGTNVGTPEPNKRVLPLDVFPSGVLENVVVQKTYTPDQSAEFGGGVINLNTKDFVEGSSFTQNIGVGYTSDVTVNNSLSYQGGKLDWLGYGVSARDFPDEFKKLAGGRRVVQRGVFGGDGFTASEIQALGQTFNKTYTPDETTGKPNYSYSGSYATGFRLLGKQAGFLGALSLSNNFITVERQNNAYSGTSTRLSPLYEYQVQESNASTLGGGIANLSVHVADKQTIRLRGLYTRSTDDYSRIMAGPNYNYGTDLVQITSLDYQARGLFLGVLSGDHNVSKLASVDINWLLSYSEASNDEPDRRENVYESNGQGGIMLSGRAALPITRIFGDMNEYDRNAVLNFSKVVPGIGKRDGNIKLGGAYRYRNRISSFRRLGFTLGPLGRSSLDLSLPPESLLVDANIKPGYFSLQEATRENDSYDANQEVMAGYAMAMVPIENKLDLLVGARLETSDQVVVSGSPFVSTVAPVDVELKNTDVLPSVNATYRLNPQMNLRGGYAVTLSRPELREMSPFDMYNYETGYSEIGNPLIQATPIRNADLRWEFYPGPRELLSASLFAKNLDRPIENVVLGSSGGYILQPVNGLDGRLRGFEVETRLGVGRLWDSVGDVFKLKRAGKWIDRWAVNFNYSRVESSVKVKTSNDASGNPIYRDGPLQGQSSYALNAGLFYGTSDIQGSLMYNSFGPRLAQFGAGAYPSSLPDIYEYPPTSLDFTLSKQVGQLFSLRLSGENLLNRPTKFTQLGLVTREYNGGRTFTLTMNIKG